MHVCSAQDIVKAADSHSAAVLTRGICGAGWALYKEKHYIWCLMLFVSQVLRSGFMCLEGLASKVES